MTLTSVLAIAAVRKRVRNAITWRFLVVTVVAMVGSMLARLSCWYLDLAPEVGDLMAMHMWWLGLAAIGVTVDRRLLPLSAAYLVAVAVSVRWPSLRLLISAAGNVAFLLNASWAWFGQDRMVRSDAAPSPERSRHE